MQQQAQTFANVGAAATTPTTSAAPTQIPTGPISIMIPGLAPGLTITDLLRGFPPAGLQPVPILSPFSKTPTLQGFVPVSGPGTSLIPPVSPISPLQLLLGLGLAAAPALTTGISIGGAALAIPRIGAAVGVSPEAAASVALIGQLAQALFGQAPPVIPPPTTIPQPQPLQ